VGGSRVWKRKQSVGRKGLAGFEYVRKYVVFQSKL
jgi:hypothetical protein